MIEIIKNSSLHLNWIYRKSKQITLPKLVYIGGNDSDVYSGFYIEPCYYPYIFDNQEIDSTSGILFVGEDEDCTATIAHEFRHHWQKLNGWDLTYPNNEFNYEFTYEKYDSEITRFYN